MKREPLGLDLRAAFPPTPECCHAALMDAARSVKEEKEMKRTTYRAVLIAAAIIVCLTAVAFAASSLKGWQDFYRDYHGASVGVPDGVYESLQKPEGLSWRVGPLTFTATELLTDGHMVISAVHVRTADGSAALITGANTGDPTDPIRANGENGRALEQRLGLAERTTWLEAAAQLNLPLYRVSADQDMAYELLDGDMMIDVLYNEDNSVTYFCMGMLDAARVGESIALPLQFDVMLTDLATGETADRWHDYDQVVTIPVCPALEERTYYPAQETIIAGHKLLKVDAVRYVTGAYLTFTYEMDYMSQPESAHELYELTIGDESGAPLPGGMNMTARLTFTIEVEEMIGVDKLPDVLTLTDQVRPNSITPEDGVVLRAK